MAQHTPGPWIRHRYSEHVEITVAAADGKHVADVYAIAISVNGERNRASTPTDEANANLIAAAPDLLWALRFLLAFYEPGQTHLDTNAWKVAEASARAAVAKAEGRS